MVKRLLDKVIVITGGTSGIGLEIAKHSISQGAYVVISGRRENEGKRIVTELGEKCHFMECDVLYEDQIRKLVEETFSKHGRIDVMFNNAGAPDFIRNIDDAYSSVVLFSHNNSCSFLTAELGGEYKHVPTCGIIIFDFDVSLWSQISNGKLNHYFPKSYR